MKRFASCLITTCLLITMSAGGLTVSAQQLKFAQKDWEKHKHPSAKRGASPEAKAAWDKLTPEQRQQVRDMLQARINEATAKVAKERRAQKKAPRTLQDAFSGRLDSTDADTTFDFTDKKGKKRKVGGKERGSIIEMLRPIDPVDPCYDCEPCYDCYPTPTPTPSPNPTPTPTPTPVPTPSGPDLDADGLPESFENQVADAFTPYYHVSGGEQYNFATFPNYPNQTPQQLLGPNPFSYFRVRPEGYFYNHLGQQVGALRVDYLTLWDYDGGLAGGLFCDLSSLGLGYLARGLGDHFIDNERSVALLAAPLVNGAYDLDPNAYGLYMFYTAAHEGETGVDRSNTADFTQNPVPAGNHIELALSRSKHATYTFNPNFYPIIDPIIILSTLSSIDFAYAVGAISDITYLILIYAANDTFYGCVVERFSDQGGRYADTRINVGEPNAPINGSAFIQDNQYGLYSKLVNGSFVF